MNVAQLDTTYSDNNFGFATLGSDLSVTKTANPPGSVTPGQTITYTITVTNTGATQQTGITVSDPLPTYTSYVANSTSATGPVTPFISTTQDNFESGNYAGGTGDWVGTWLEIGENNGPATDNVRIIADLGDQSARIRTSPNRGLERTVDLSACSSATLTFDRRRSSIDAGEGVRAYATDGVSTIPALGQRLWYGCCICANPKP